MNRTVRTLTRRSLLAMIVLTSLLLTQLLGVPGALADTVVATTPTGSQSIAVAVNPVTNRIYVANYASDTVSVIDGATGALIATVNLGAGAGPKAVAVNPVTNKIYISNYGTDTVTVIDGVTNGTSSVPVGSGPAGLAVNPITNKIYVANSNEVTATVIDGATGSTGSISVNLYPVAVAVNPVTNMIYVASKNGFLAMIDGAYNDSGHMDHTPVGHSAEAVVVNPATNQIYAADTGGSGVLVLDGATNNPNGTLTGASPSALAVNPVTNKIYVANSGGNSVTVIDGADYTATATVHVGTHPNAVALNPVTGKIYVANAGSNNVSVINGADNSVVTMSAGTDPQAVAVNPVTGKVYVANNGSGDVTIIDGASNATTTVSTGTSPQAAAVNPATGEIYVANTSSNNVTVIDAATGTVLTTIPTGSGPRAVAVNPATNKIYVVNGGAGADSVAIIDGGTHTPTTVPVGHNPYAAAVNAVTNQIYVTNSGDGTVTVIDGATGSTSTTVAAGSQPRALAVNPVTNRVYVANATSNNVTVIDAVNNATTTINVGTGPRAVAVNPVTNKIYVVNTNNSVSVIDGAYNDQAHTATINVGSTPVDVAVNPITNKVYVVNQGSNNVTLVDGAYNDQAHTSQVATGTTPVAVAVNPVMNKIYVANQGGNNVTVIDGAKGTATAVPAGQRPGAVAVSLGTNQAVVANAGSGNVTLLAEQPADPTPLTTNISPTPGTSGTPQPSFDLTAASGYGAGGPTPHHIYYQVDTWTGPWQAVTPVSGANGSTGALSLRPGEHMLYAFATDGQDATSVNTGAGNSVILGQIARYDFVVPPPVDGPGTLTMAPSTSVLAGQTGIARTFTFTAGAGGLFSGELDIALPSGWSGGSVTSTTGIAAMSGGSIQVTNITLAAGGQMTIDLTGATAGSTVGANSFAATERSTNGGILMPLASWPSITVNASPDGSGTLTVSPSSVLRGQSGVNLTFTYTAAAGGLSGGELNVALPSGWTGGSVTSSAGIAAISGGSIQVTNITVAAGGQLTIDLSGATAGSTLGANSFAATERSTAGGTFTALATSPSLTVTAPPPPVPPTLTALELGGPTSLHVGETATYTAKAVSSDGSRQAVEASWSAEGGSFTGSNWTAPTKPGGYTLKAASGNLFGEVWVTVLPGPAFALALRAPRSDLQPGDTVAFTAVATDRYGNPVVVPTLTWSATGGTITDAGLFTAGPADGPASVTASGQGIQASADLRITPPPQPPVTLTDIAGHPAQSAIEALVRLGVVTGFPDGTFRPDGTLTRAQAAVIFARALGLKPQAAVQLRFTDSSEVGEWAAPSVAAIAEQKLLTGYPDGSFRPGAPVTRAELAIMLARALKQQGITVQTPAPAISDQLPDWAAGAIRTAAAAGMLSPGADGTFAPAAPATRGEAAVAFARLMALLPAARAGQSHGNLRPRLANANPVPFQGTGFLSNL